VSRRPFNGVAGADIADAASCDMCEGPQVNPKRIFGFSRRAMGCQPAPDSGT
jgi:hypothetical protein